jgi:hypothetical protein
MTPLGPLERFYHRRHRFNFSVGENIAIDERGEVVAMLVH